MSAVGTLTAWLAGAMLFAAPAGAQVGEASITGVVRDASGAVLPGATVEAASPALIEKVRSVTTDSTGQYRIVSLPPGLYTVTFALRGFATVKRDGVELAGSFTATLNVDLRIGDVAETITVTGGTPIVDVQSARQQRVLDHTIIDAVPAGRTFYNLAVIIPGVGIAGGGQQDVGGSGSVNATPTLMIHGSTGTDQKWLQNGVAMTAMASTGYDAPMPYNPAATQEVRIDTSSMSIELGLGGIRFNVIPKDGGNSYKGTLFANYANSSMQGNNLTTELRDAGFGFPDSVKLNWDVNPGAGGPVMHDALWFYGSYRNKGEYLYPAGIYNNLNANDPTKWTYVADRSARPENHNVARDGQVRLTWQADQKNKFGLVYHQGYNCSCPTGISPTTSPEAVLQRPFPHQIQVQGDWTAPVTNRLLFEAGVLRYTGSAGAFPSDGLNPQMIAVTEQSNGMIYRAGDPNYRNRLWTTLHARAAASYITGAHALKFGLNHTSGYNHFDRFANQPVAYRFNDGVPNQVTEIAYPSPFQADIDHDMGVFGQDKWTLGNLTLDYGVRLDWFTSSYPQITLGPTPLTPTRNKTYPAAPGIDWKDATPHIGAAYNLFGNGRTAVKAGINKYVEAMGGDGLAAALSPVNNLVLTAPRSWGDANKNFVPDCDLTNPLAHDECGAMNPNFGKDVAASQFDPAAVSGWNSRGSNWEFSTGIQHELVPRMSVSVDYFRRWYGNFRVTDNLTLSPSDYDTFSIVAPMDVRLPGGGGQTVTGLYDVVPEKFGLPAKNFVTLASNYGAQIQHWNGVDITMNARLPRVVLQGGVSTGKTTTDFCEVAAKLPEALFGVAASGIVYASGANPPATVWTPLQFCHQESPFLTQVKFLGTYTIPKIDVLISGTFQSLPGPTITANYVVNSAAARPSLGRPLSGGTANITAYLFAPGNVIGERLNQLDLRVGKNLKVGRTQTRLNFDVYNALNGSAVLAVNNNYASWQRPTSVLQPRFAKVSVQLDF